MNDDFEDLKKFARSTEEDLRLLAVRRLHADGDIRAVPLLRKLAEDDSSMKVRFMAKKALFLIQKRTSATDLPVSMFSSDKRTGACVIDVAEFSRLYLAADGKARKKLIRGAVRLGDRKLVPFLTQQALAEQVPALRAALVLAVGIIGDRGEVPLVVGFLNDPHKLVKANAVKALGQLDAVEALPFLAKFVDDPDEKIRTSAISALRASGKDTLLEVFSEMLDSEQEWMRHAAAACLCVFSSSSFFPLLKRIFEDPDEDIRRKARIGLEKLAIKGHDEADKILGAPPEETARFHVPVNPVDGFIDSTSLIDKDNSAAGKIDEIELITLERDVDCGKRLAAALRIETDTRIVASLITAIGRLGDRSLSGLVEPFLSHKEARIRANAVEALATLDDEKLLAHADELLSDPSNRVLANAITALKDHRPLEVLEALGELVQHENELFRRSALWAIADMSDERIVYFIETLLEDENEEIRRRTTQYIQMLREQGDPLVRDIMAELPEHIRKNLEQAFDSEQAERDLRAELPEDK